MKILIRSICWACAGLAALLAGGCALAPREPASRYFFVGGRYVGEGSERKLMGQMYVQEFRPAGRPRAFPVVMIHGTAQSGNNFIGTPDGRAGWAQEFAAAGFATYVVDQVGRARSGTSSELYGDYVTPSLALAQFLAKSPATAFPTAALNSQWPGQARPGEPFFDQFAAQQVPYIRDTAKNEELNLAANLALLERIGPAIVLTHSQSGVLGWKLADTRPDLVKAVVAVEPNGPPFRELLLPYRDSAPPAGAPWYRYGPALARPWGLTRLPLAFAPALPEPPTPKLQERAAAPNLVPCWLQDGTPRSLPELAKVSVLLLTGEASFRTGSDHCTALFLRQAGVAVDHIRLEEQGVRGNGHMMMLEANSSDVARAILDWLRQRAL